MKKSIYIKFFNVTLISLLLLAVTIGSVGVFSVNHLSKEDSCTMMIQACDKETLRFSNRLNLIEHSVETIQEFAEQVKAVYKDDYVALAQAIRKMSIPIAELTEGVRAVYFRLDPAISGNGVGGFLSRKSDQGSFIEYGPTDITQYDSIDDEHVGWFYIPKNAGKPVWLSPYVDENTDGMIISYVIPFFDGGRFIGVIGMDVDFRDIVRMTKSVELYETGYASLVDMREHIRYAVNNEDVIRKYELSTTLYNYMTTINRKGETLKYVDERGRVSMIYFNILPNGMRLMVSAPATEIYESRNRLVILTIGISSGVMLLALAWVLRSVQKIVQPISCLTGVTEAYAKGNWSENYKCDTSDELQRLSESIAIMADTTRKYIHEINTFARTDALTGLQNKMGYLEYIEILEHQRTEEGAQPYGVVVLDLNYLKKTNDNYGHEVGDLLICSAGRYIRECFPESAAFRIGGDEFVVILKDESYCNRQKLVKNLCDGILEERIKVREDVCLSMAWGLAECAEKQSYKEVFEQADRRMYEQKKRMKAQRCE